MRQLLSEMMEVDDMEVADGQEIQPEKTPITPELVASLVEQMPELADVDQAELEKGLDVEQEHLETVGGDMLIVAKIAFDHIKEFEGKSYYDALAAMEEELKETPEEEEVEHSQEDQDMANPTPPVVPEVPMESVTKG